MTLTVLRTLVLFVASATSALVLGAKAQPSPVVAEKSGRLVYAVDPNGDRVPDFSYAGYRGGGVPLPVIPARVHLEPRAGDTGEEIQRAIDYVAALPADAQGYRGAVELAPGRFEISRQLKIRASGVVLRGAGDDESGTTLVATGTDRRPLIELAGNDVRRNLGAATRVQGERVAVGATQLRVAQVGEIKVGTRITIERPSPKEWIEFIGMDDAPGRLNYQWRPNAFNVRWDRVVTAVKGDVLTLDAPLTVALEAKFGGATVQAYEQQGYLSEVGVENLRCESTYDAANPLDEQHAWNAIDLHAVRDGWVSNVTATHFAGSAVQVGAKVERVTVQDVRSREPISELGGYRRLAFHSRGQQVLFLRCSSEHGRNDFTVGYLAAGPTVFLDCEARETSSFSGSIGSWASGLLFDGVKIDGGALRLDNLETFNQGVGWAAVNSMIWQSAAGVIANRRPPGAQNWAVGIWGQYLGDGHWSVVNEFAQPESLYRAQLAERLGAGALTALAARKFSAQDTSLKPWSSSDVGAALGPTSRAKGDDAARVDEVGLPRQARDPEPVERTGAAPTGKKEIGPLKIVHGVLQIDGRPLTGQQTSVTWWRGWLTPARASEIGPALTRFSPGRTGTGLTDEPRAVAEAMVRNGQVALRHNYGLWYDRRRDDHQMIRRPDAEVWPPFFEQPFARSGQGKAWDGLSRYDLTKYNPWYFQRLREFASVARERGLVLINEMYFQHNIIESGGHWVDSPWRPVNNINQTGFTEPPPFTGDTIKMANEFYDVTHPVRRDLHRAYIRQCLANLADEPNVIHTLTAENSGPLHFMQFWLDVVAEWERETGKHPLIALSAPKDVQDAILADPVCSRVVDIIELLYWWRTDAGDEYAPKGGQQLAPRQHLRLWKGGKPSAHSLAAMVREYRTKYPDKAVIADGNWGAEAIAVGGQK